MNNPAVLLLIFRRADLVIQQIDALRLVRPERLYVAADGPRADHPGEASSCNLARRALTLIDWPCQVKTLFRPQNLGVRRAVSQAIDWFFENEEQGIILEEDCLPHPDFFPFCAALLEKYRNDPRIMQISGTNFQPQARAAGKSYFFSRYNHVWGWATWRRAWALYRPRMEGLREFLEEARTSGFWENRREEKYWTKIFFRAWSNRVDSWAYRWSFSMWAEGGLCIYPESNLVANLGFRSDGTNTKGLDKRKANRPLTPLKALVHPVTVIPCRRADLWTFEHLYWGDSVPRFIHHLERLGELGSQALRKVLSELRNRTPWGRNPRPSSLRARIRSKWRGVSKLEERSNQRMTAANPKR